MPADSKTPFYKRPVFGILLLFCTSLIIFWPYLQGGFQADDIILYNIIKQDPLPFSRWLGVWSCDDTACFANTWWADPDFGGTFWRPIPSLILEGSIHIFGRNAFPLHLFSILLHGAVASMLFLLVGRLTTRYWLGLIAGLFFVVCEDHSMTVGWITTMTDLLCTLFILLAFYSHLEWLRDRKNIWLAGSLIALILALASKESAAVAPLGMVLLTFLMPKGADGDLADGNLKKRLVDGFRDYLSSVPQLLLMATYLVFYKLIPLGTMNSLLYYDPISKPMTYLSHLWVNLPVMWLGTFTLVPPWYLMYDPGKATLFAAAGLLIFIAWVIALWPFRNRAVAVWAFILYLVALLPQLGTDASERGLYFPMVSASILIAIVAASIKPIADHSRTLVSATTRWTRFMGWAALIGLFTLSVYYSQTLPLLMADELERPGKELSTAIRHIEEYQPEHIVLLNTSGMGIGLYAGDMINYLMDEPQDIWVLSSAEGINTIERTGNSSFIIRANRSGWLSNVFARMLRTSEAIEIGDTYDNGLFTATIIETNEAGNDVLAVSFEFRVPLDDPGTLFMRWTGRAFEPIDLASLPPGEVTPLRDPIDQYAD